MKRFALATLLGVALGATALVLSACGPGSDLPDPGTVTRETTETSVVYATGRSLMEERHIVDAEDVYRSTLEEWLEAMPVGNPDVAIVQPEADVLGIELDEDGVLTIDWSADVLAFEATQSEQLIALAGILRTFGQFPEVEQVRFTVEGQTQGEAAGMSVEAFWGGVSLVGQPWDVIRPGTPPSERSEETSEAGSP